MFSAQDFGKIKGGGGGPQRRITECVLGRTGALHMAWQNHHMRFPGGLRKQQSFFRELRRMLLYLDLLPLLQSWASALKGFSGDRFIAIINVD